MQYQWKLVFATALVVVGTLALNTAAQEESEVVPDDSEVVNEQARIETTENGVEIEIRSSRPFPVRALPPVLRIGDLDFIYSRNPADGRLDTLIFLVPAEEFADIDPQNASARVFYALGTKNEVTPRGRPEAIPESGGLVWNFGDLRKEMLDAPRLWDVRDGE